MNEATGPQRSASLVLALLLLAYIFNFLDRQILGILAQPIKADLHLSDTQFGAIGGLAFALLYSVLGIPLAYLADKTSRSACRRGVARACGAGSRRCAARPPGFGQLFLYRLGVGVGEAGGVAPSYALIADYFPPERRARALAIFSLGVPIGLAGGTLIGAYHRPCDELARGVRRHGHRRGRPGAGHVVRRARSVAGPRRTARAPLASVFPMLARKPAFWLLSFASSSSSLCGYGLALWTPSVMMRSFGLDLLDDRQVPGVAPVDRRMRGRVCRRLAGRPPRPGRPRLVCQASGDRLARSRCRHSRLGLFAPSLWIAWPLLLIANAVNILWLGPVTLPSSISFPVRCERPLRQASC